MEQELKEQQIPETLGNLKKVRAVVSDALPGTHSIVVDLEPSLFREARSGRGSARVLQEFCRQNGGECQLIFP